MASSGDPTSNDASVPEPPSISRATAPSDPSRTIDRFNRIAVGSNAQANVVSLLKSCIDQDLTGEDLRREISESLQIEDITSVDVLSNSDLFRRMRLMLHDAGIDTTTHAAYSNEPLYKRILRAVWDRENAERGLELSDQARRIISASTGTPVNVLSTTAPIYTSARMPFASTPATNNVFQTPGTIHNDEVNVPHSTPFGQIPLHSVPRIHRPALDRPGMNTTIVSAPAAPPIHMKTTNNFGRRIHQNYSSGNDSVRGPSPPSAPSNQDDERQAHTENAPGPNMNSRSMPEQRAQNHNRSASDERRKALKAFQQYYQKCKFAGTFEEDWERFSDDYTDMCEDYDVPDGDRIYFLKYALKGDAREFFEGLNRKKCQFAEVNTAFAGRYSSDAKRGEISARLTQLSLEDCRDNEEDDYAALESLVARIDRLAPMAKKKDRDEDAKIGFLKEAVVGTQWGLRAASMLPHNHTFQELINALNTAQRDIHRHTAADQHRSSGKAGSFRKSLWKAKGRNGDDDELRDTLFAGQARYGRDPTQSRNTTRRDTGIPVPRTVTKCFNCEREGCALSRCKMPKEETRIARNLAAWRKEKGINKPISSINLAEIVEISEAEIGEVFIAERFLGEMADSRTENEGEDGEGRERSVMHTNLCAYADQSIDSSDLTAKETRDDYEQEDF